MLHLPLPPLHGLLTERLIFHAPTLDDADRWMEYMCDAEAIRFMAFEPGSRADCERFIQRSLDRMATDGSGLHALRSREDHRLVGMVGLLTQEVDGEAELEIGYHLLPSEWGKGLASEAAIACKEFVRAHDLAPSVISLIDQKNTRSQAVARRNGMRIGKRTVHRGVPADVWRVKL